MTTLEAIRKPIEDKLQEFDAFVRHNFAVGEDGLLSSMLDYILSSRGKGLRPTVVMLAAGATSRTGNFGRRSMLAAMLIEMIHVASLIHDDVIDESDMRRGRQSVNARWQSRNAVIVGDYVLARNMSLGLQSGQYDLLSHIIANMTTLCEGEIVQSDHARKLDTTRAAYLDIINKKTASLFATCASAGAMSVGADREAIALMHRYGEALGIAFQIADDLLDYSPDNHTGKPCYNDLRERKITLPLIEVLELSNDDERQAILSTVERCATDEDAIAEVGRIVAEKGGVAKARQTMERYLVEAARQLSALPQSDYTASLVSLCEYVAERDR